MIRPRSNRICVGTLVAVFAALAPAGLQAAQSPALPAPYETYGGTAWTVADFDGDGNPDILTARTELASGGFRHRIEIHLSAGAGRVISFAVDGLQPGIQVAARDVNGDHDVDLVVTTAVSHQTVGVWINSGVGEFSRGREANPGPPPAQLRASDGLTQSSAPPRLSYIPRPRSQPLHLASCFRPLPPPPSSDGLSGSSPAPATMHLAGRPPARAPPAVL